MYREMDSDEAPLLLVAFLDKVLGIDRKTGEVRWEQRLDQLGAAVELAVRGDRVYAATANGKLHCLRYDTGEKIATKQLPGTYRGRPTMVADGEHIFVGAGGEITCVDRDLNVLWTNGLKGRGVGDVALGFPNNLRQADRGR